MTGSNNLQEPIAQTMTYGGGLSAITAWGLSLGDMAAIVGATTAVLGGVFQVYFMIRRERRARELHKLTIKQLESEK